MRLYTLLLFWVLLALNTIGAQSSAPYVVVVTTDGFRSRELFEGADSALIAENTRMSDDLYRKYYHSDLEIRRRLLLPFFWDTLAKAGQVYGNQQWKNKVVVGNSSCISYPGYSELFTGFTDDKHIFLNTKKKNPHTNVLEYLAGQKKVAAFCSWDVFPYILNEERAGFLVNAGFEPLPTDKVADFNCLNEVLGNCARPWKESVRPDSITWAFAKNYLQEERPDVLYIALGETDEYAHEGKYGHYLEAAHQFDRILGELWQWIQQDTHYCDRTSLVVSTDHGRSNRHWRQHIRMLKGSEAIWMAVAGPDILPMGEIKRPMRIRQAQMAQTIAGLTGGKFHCEHPVAPAVALGREKKPSVATAIHPLQTVLLLRSRGK